MLREGAMVSRGKEYVKRSMTEGGADVEVGMSNGPTSVLRVTQSSQAIESQCSAGAQNRRTMSRLVL